MLTTVDILAMGIADGDIKRLESELKGIDDVPLVCRTYNLFKPVDMSKNKSFMDPYHPFNVYSARIKIFLLAEVDCVAAANPWHIKPTDLNPLVFAAAVTVNDHLSASVIRFAPDATVAE